ncbi:MAG TPA: TPM domain-containing protein [Polyangiaceae bacterium]|nr:TPM domain-containing protein [Polyangiaceae bacterium]
MRRPSILRALVRAVGTFGALLLVVLTWLAATAGSSRADAALPELRGLVTDGANLLDASAAARLDARLTAYQRATGHQFGVVTVPSLEGAAIEDYSIRLAEKWKLGDAKRDDGLLLVIAPRDRQMRIEVGYGLEGAIPDALAARVIRYELTPAFQKGDFAGGIDSALDVLEKAAQGEAVRVGPPEESPRARAQSWLRLLPLALLLLVFFLDRGGRGGGMGGFLAGMLIGSMRGGGGGGGGGGFGGGGGGGFGGGGASGRW